MKDVLLSWVGVTASDGRYRITSRLGEGGMGLIYKAHDLRLDADVVIKVPRRSMLEEPRFAERFQREIRALVKLSHPHVVKILDVGTHDGLPFAVMQYLSGGDLDTRRPRDSKEAEKWLERATDSDYPAEKSRAEELLRSIRAEERR